MTGTFRPRSVSRGRMMSTATRSASPSASLSTPATSTNTVSTMASARENTGWVAPSSITTAGGGAAAAGGTVLAARVVITASGRTGAMSVAVRLRMGASVTARSYEVPFELSGTIVADTRSRLFATDEVTGAVACGGSGY